MHRLGPVAEEIRRGSLQTPELLELYAEWQRYADEHEAVYHTTQGAFNQLTREHGLDQWHSITGSPNLRPDARVIVDNVASEAECQELLFQLRHIINDASYNVYPAMEAVLKGVDMFSVYPSLEAAGIAPTVLRVRERMRALVEGYFGKEVYHDATHFTRRRALRPDLQAHHGLWQQGFDHGVHVDKCRDEPGGDCSILPDHCCYWRDFSAILFLNDGTDAASLFEGGTFFFRDRAPGTGGGYSGTLDTDYNDTLVPAKCGRMVAFDAGIATPHGVTKTSGPGERVAIASWMTLDPRFDELHRLNEEWPEEWKERIISSGAAQVEAEDVPHIVARPHDWYRAVLHSDEASRSEL